MRLASGVSRVALDHEFLDRDRAFDRRDDGGKLQQQAVAGRLDNSAAEARHDRPRRLAMLANASAVPASSSPIRRE